MPRITHQIGELSARIDGLLERRRVALFALCQEYKLGAQNKAREAQGEAQGQGNLWTNRTGDAVAGVTGFAEMDEDGAGWGLFHVMDYGKWLELKGLAGTADVRPLLNPTARGLAPEFLERARRLFGG